MRVMHTEGSWLLIDGLMILILLPYENVCHQKVQRQISVGITAGFSNIDPSYGVMRNDMAKYNEVMDEIMNASKNQKINIIQNTPSPA